MATLSVSETPSLDGYSVSLSGDPTIRTQFDSGHVQARTKHTQLFKRWNLRYRGLTDTDKSNLETMQNTVGVGGDTVGYYDTPSGNTYVVRLDSPIKFQPDGRVDRWVAELSITQADTTETAMSTNDYGYGTYDTGYYLPV